MRTIKILALATTLAMPLLVRNERVQTDLLAQITLIPSVPVDCANHSERVT